MELHFYEHHYSNANELKEEKIENRTSTDETENSKS